jgi:hypothetical protein
MPRIQSGAAAAVLAVLAAAVAYEGSVAGGALKIGPEPGKGPVGGGFVLAVAVVALVAGAGLCVVRGASGSRDDSEPAEWLLAPAGATFVLVRFYAFDPYYAPSLRRFSEGGLVAPGLVYVLALIALVTAAVTRARPRFGRAATAVVLVVCAVAALAEAGGH